MSNDAAGGGTGNGAAAFAFDQIAWQSPAPGLRTKTLIRGDKKLRMVEFGAAFVEPNWCTRGHAGLVLEGEMEINFDGRIERFRAGDALVIPNGEAHRHRHHTTIRTARLFLVEDAT
jgi:quercetin dioxygenase-like cupin family protein